MCAPGGDVPAGPGAGACGNEGASEAPGVGETPTPVLLRGDVAVGAAWVCARGPEFTNATGLTTREKGHSKVVRGRLSPCYIGAQRDRTPAAWMLLPKESLPKIPQTAVEWESSYTLIYFEMARGQRRHRTRRKAGTLYSAKGLLG